MHDFRSSVFAENSYGMDAPESEMIFIFQKVKPTWNQPDLSSVYMAACLSHLKNKLYQPACDRRDRCHYLVLRKPEFLNV